MMSLSNAYLQKYLERNIDEVKQELKDQVHKVRTGSCATGFVSAKAVNYVETHVKEEKRIVLSYDGDDPNEKVTSIKQD